MHFRLSTLLLLAVVLWSSLAAFGGLFGIVVFGWIVATAIGAPKSRDILASSFFLLLFIGCIVPAVREFHEGETERHNSARCSNNLKSIAFALHNYQAANGCYPPAYIADMNGHPMHSWRVLLLPYLGYDSLYKRYSFKEPWDGPNNKKLLAVRPEEYACPYDRHEGAPGAMQTSYVAVVGSNAAWHGGEPTNPERLSRNPSNTIAFVETCDADIPWTEPKDLDADLQWTEPEHLYVEPVTDTAPGSSVVTPSSRHGEEDGLFYSRRVFLGFHVAFADGRVAWLSPGSAALPGLFRIDGATEAAFAEANATNRLPPSRYGNVRLNWPNCLVFGVWVGSAGWLLFRAERRRRTATATSHT
jgi:hypothetical protein